MSNTVWLTIIGLGEDGLDGLSLASQNALTEATIIFGSRRLLSFLKTRFQGKKIEWPVPFEKGVSMLLAQRGKSVVMLASGDPFWFGAGNVLAKYIAEDEWIAHPNRSCFSLAACKLGWAIQDSLCHALHASPFSKIRKDLQYKQKLLVTLRNGDAVADLAKYLSREGFGESKLIILEALGGKRQRVRKTTAEKYDWRDVNHPVMAAIEPSNGPSLPYSSGRDNRFFDHDGQITKTPMRALTLSALAPCAGELLWDIGAGSGSISIEWLLAHPTCKAIAIEKNGARCDRIAKNAYRYGVDRLKVVRTNAPDGLKQLEKPDAVFIGGGLDINLLNNVLESIESGTRLVINVVTLESEIILLQKQREFGGQLTRFEISNLGSIGVKSCWKAAYPITQWSVTV